MPNPKSKRLYLLSAARIIAALGLLLGTSARGVMYTQYKVTGVSIYAVGNGTLFTMSDGSLWGMGENTNGNLGVDPAIAPYINLPTRIVASNVTAISAGRGFTLFKKSDASLWGLGDNTKGQLGLGSGVATTFMPQQIVTNVGTFSAGNAHSLFIAANPTFFGVSLFAMGDNEFGELGDGSYVNKFVPEPVFTPHGTRAGLPTCAAGFLYSLFCFTTASSGTIDGMGSDDTFALGGNDRFLKTNTPIFIGSLTATAISAGFMHNLYLAPDGSLWGLGDNVLGELGIVLSTNYAASLQRIVPSGVTAISAGFEDSLFVKSDGSLWGMGVTFTNTPTELVASGVTAAAAGSFGTFFYVKSDGSLWGFGNNLEGELGDGTYTNHPVWEEIVAPLQLTIVRSGQNAVLYWPADATGYVLQSTTNLSPDAWSPVPVTPVNIGGQNVVIDVVSEQSKFYRLSKPAN
jgi:alpha-tubulin suppressor-like RCC1 family protein